MSILTSLKNRPTRWLCGGEVLSVTGDEIYKASLMWLATEYLGKQAGLISGLESGTVVVFGLIASRLTLKRPTRAVMTQTQLLKAITMLALPSAALLFEGSAPFLMPAAVILAAVSIYFEPALQRAVPLLCDTESSRQATNVLIEATRRLASIIGPGLMAALSFLFAPIYNFLWAGAAFFLSAISFRNLPPTRSRELSGGVHFWFPQKGRLRVALAASVSVWGLWALVFQLGLPLLVRERFPENAAAHYGSTLAFYGFSNVIANLALGKFRFENSLRPMWLGIGLMGLGFIFLSLATHYPWFLFSAAVAAMGGPLSDLAFLNAMQNDSKDEELEQVYRLRMIYANAIMLGLFVASPLLFKLSSVFLVVLGSGVLLVAGSATGLLFKRR